MNNEVIVGILGKLIAEFIMVAVSWWAYNSFLAVPLGLPQVSYWQMWLVRLLLGYMANSKIL